MRNTISQSSPSLYGLILAGGKSSRMGFDKGIIHYHGKPQREYLFDLLGKYCNQVFTSCQSSHDIFKTFNPLPDQFKIDSPLNGILSAFEFNKNVAWLTAPIDMPMIDNEVIELLIQHRDKSKIATCFFDSDGQKPEPLLTIWEPSAFHKLLQFYKTGKISPRDLLIQSDINILSAPSARSLININDEEEWRQFKKDQNYLCKGQ